MAAYAFDRDVNEQYPGKRRLPDGGRVTQKPYEKLPVIDETGSLVSEKQSARQGASTNEGADRLAGAMPATPLTCSN